MACPFNSISHNYNAYTNLEYNTKISVIKRVSSFFSKRLTGSMSVEAAFSIPIFLFFMVNMLSMITMYAAYSSKLAKVDQSAKILASISTDMNSYGDDLVISSDLVEISPFVKPIGFKSAYSYACMKYKKWNGYDLSGSNSNLCDDEYVYITQTGGSYHRSKNCRHLLVTITTTTVNEIETLRNSEGKKYYACEKCKGIGTGLLFVTQYGEKYHSNASCSGLKRTIKTIKLSEVGGRSACRDCAGY